MALLSIEGLRVTYPGMQGSLLHVVNGVDLELYAGEVCAVVGESGSGKSQTAMAAMGLLDEQAQVSGVIRFQGNDLVASKAWHGVRGSRIAMVFQDPMSALNPYLTIERQMTEVLMVHKGCSRLDARDRAIKELTHMRIPDAARSIMRYPHEFSGGMRQRVLLAMALLCEPDLLIADEATAALDVTVQAQILQLLKEVRDSYHMSIWIITHDLGVVAALGDRVAVMYAGRIVEAGPVQEVFDQPAHPYTQALLEAMPRDDQPLRPIRGQPPSPAAIPPGCPFHPRCPHCFGPCDKEMPRGMSLSGQHKAACHLLSHPQELAS